MRREVRCERVKEGLQNAARGAGARGIVRGTRGSPGNDAGDTPRYGVTKFARFGPAS
jgi:hypothetical protein